MALGKYLRTTTVGTTMEGTFTTEAEEAQLFVFATNVNRFYLSQSPSGANYWTGPQCSGPLSECVARFSLSNAGNDPSYRRFRFDLNGNFQLATLSVQVPIYALPAPTGSPLTPTKLALYGKSAPSDEWVDLTSSLAVTFNCVTGASCTISFNVLRYSITTLGHTALDTWRAFELEFQQMSPSQFDLPNGMRYYSARGIFPSGDCSCNGHSSICIASSGGCSQQTAPQATSSPATTRPAARVECALGYFINPANAEPSTSPTATLPCSAVRRPAAAHPHLHRDPAEPVRLLGARWAEIVTGGTFLEATAAVFSTFFDNGGPCVACSCHGHGGCDALKRHLRVRPALRDDGRALRDVRRGHCRLLTNATTQACQPCQCNGHAEFVGPADEDLCDADVRIPARRRRTARATSAGECKVVLQRDGHGPQRRRGAPCACNGHQSQCYAFEGDCERDFFGSAQECDGNTMGDSCQFCRPGFYRPTGAPLTDDCVPCSCNGHGLETEYDAYGWTAGLTAECNPDGGVCNCDPVDNVMGDSCENCAVGYFGVAESGGNCSACECNGHKGESNICRVTDGDCNYDYDGNPDPCSNNTAGASCELCLSGFFHACDDPSTLGTELCVTTPTEACLACDCNGHADEKTDDGDDVRHSRRQLHLRRGDLHHGRLRASA